MGDVDVLYSYEVGMDALDFLGQLRVVIMDAADQLQATAYTTGSGTGQPRGIITAVAAVPGGVVAGTGTEASTRPTRTTWSTLWAHVSPCRHREHVPADGDGERLAEVP
jgi:hypothetical protein